MVTGEIVGRPVTITVLFVDLVGSTARQARLGDDANDEFRRRFTRSLEDVIARREGSVVKGTGDGMMVVFRRSSTDSLAGANEMHDVIEALDPDEPAQIYVGISAGDAIEEDGDFFGQPVNVAARLCAAARPGQTLVDDVVPALVDTRAGFRFRRLEPKRLKGLPEKVPCSELLRDGRTPGHSRRSVMRRSKPRPEPLSAPRSEARPEPPPKRRKVFAVVGGVALLAMAVAGVVAVTSGGDDTPAPQVVLAEAEGYKPTYDADSACPETVVVAFRNAKCGTLSVPEDRGQPENGRLVRLLVVRAPARGEVTEAPVLDFGADTLASSPVREHADEYRLVPRGFVGSEPVLDCPAYAAAQNVALAAPSDDPATVAALAGALAACHSETVAKGIDPDMYDYRTDAEDMLDLMRVLDLTKVHLVSGREATIAALRLIDLAPKSVLSLTLQSPVPPGKSYVTDPTGELAAAFDEYVRQCNAVPRCAALAAPGDLHDLYATLQASYASSPAVLRGSAIGGPLRDVLVDGASISRALVGSFVEASAIPSLAVGLSQPRGSVDPLIAGRILTAQSIKGDSNPPWGAVLSRACSYDVRTITDAHSKSSQLRPELSGVDQDVAALESQCEAWTVEPLPDEDFASRRRDTPTLIVQGGLSPVSSATWGEEIRRDSLPHATVMTLPSATTTVISDPEPQCLQQMRQTFIGDPDADLDAESCANAQPPIPFVTTTPG